MAALPITAIPRMVCLCVRKRCKRFVLSGFNRAVGPLPAAVARARGTYLAPLEHMRQRVLITGGGGFIGSHLADELLSAGYDVRALDNLDPQVHPQRKRPPYLDPDVELRIDGGVRRADASVMLRGAAAVAGHTSSFSGLYPAVRPALVNGMAGAVVVTHGRLFAVMAFTVSEGKVTRIDSLLDPERLDALELDLSGQDGST